MVRRHPSPSHPACHKHSLGSHAPSDDAQETYTHHHAVTRHSQPTMTNVQATAGPSRLRG